MSSKPPTKMTYLKNKPIVRVITHTSNNLATQQLSDYMSKEISSKEIDRRSIASLSSVPVIASSSHQVTHSEHPVMIIQNCSSQPESERGDNEVHVTENDNGETKKSKFCRISYYQDNLFFFLTVILYLLIQIGLALLQFFLYIESNWAIRIARVSAILIYFNTDLVILLALRRFNTWIRNSIIGRYYLPIDKTIKYHKFCGFIILVLIMVHMIAHCINLCWFFIFNTH